MQHVISPRNSPGSNCSYSNGRRTVRATLRLALDLHHAGVEPSEKKMTEGIGVVTCGCNSYQNKADTIRQPARNKEKKDKAEGQTKRDVQYTATAAKNPQEAIKITAKKTNKKKPHEPYQDILAFMGTGQILLFKSIYYKVSVSVGIFPSRTFPGICIFKTGAGRSLIRGNVLDQSWLDNVRQCDIPEI